MAFIKKEIVSGVTVIIDYIRDLVDDIFKEFNNVNKKIDEIYKKNVYSSEEMPVGTWVDGKTIYRKVYDIGTVHDDKNIYTYEVNISNLDKVVNVYGGYIYQNKGYVPFNFYNFTVSKGTWVYFDGNNINISSEFAGTEGKIIIEYTKTVD